jgi:hypothetical protein
VGRGFQNAVGGLGDGLYGDLLDACDGGVFANALAAARARCFRAKDLVTVSIGTDADGVGGAKYDDSWNPDGGSHVHGARVVG